MLQKAKFSSQYFLLNLISDEVLYILKHNSYESQAERFCSAKYWGWLVLVPYKFIVEGATIFGILLGVEVNEIHPENLRGYIDGVVRVTKSCCIMCQLRKKPHDKIKDYFSKNINGHLYFEKLLNY